MTGITANALKPSISGLYFMSLYYLTIALRGSDIAFFRGKEFELSLKVKNRFTQGVIFCSTVSIKSLFYKNLIAFYNAIVIFILKSTQETLAIASKVSVASILANESE